MSHSINGHKKPLIFTSSHLPPFLNPCSISFSTHKSFFQFLKNLISSIAAFLQVRKWRRRDKLTISGRGCSRAPLPLLPAPPLLPPASLLPPAPLPLVPLPPAPLLPSQAPVLECLLRGPLLPLLSLPILLVMLRVPPLWPLPRGDIILELGPHHQLLHIPCQPSGPHRPRGFEHQAQGSHLHRDPGHHPLHFIRVLPELQTYLQGPSSGDLTSPVTLSWGMLAAGTEISMRRCTMISRHFPRTQGFETPCSSYNDTIWSHSWCHVSSIILGSSSSSIIQ